MKTLLYITLILQCLNGLAQVSIPGIPFVRIDKYTDSTSLNLYPSIKYQEIEGFKLINPLFKASYNSRYPRGYNDGPIWKGSGLNFEAHAGFIGTKGKFSYAFTPTIYYAQNNSFFTRHEEPFKYFYSDRIDWVQRYGDSGYFNFHLGQSEMKFSIGQFSTSISTQNYSLGPAIFNPILLSRQGGGFPHIRLGIDPTKLVIGKKNLGKIETHILYGLLKESNYFDDSPDNNNRYFNGLTLSYSPSFLPQLTLGINKVLYKQTRYFENTDLLSPLFIVDDGVVDGDTLSPNDTFDQMASISIEWNLKEAGFRTYLEFAKNDFTSGGAGLRFFAIEPEHSRAYTIGFEKLIESKNGAQIRIGYEHTNLSRNHTYLWRAAPTFYIHGVNHQGYTNDGQLIGAGIGPGGNSDHLRIELEYSESRLGFLLQRIEHNKDYFVVNIQHPHLHDIEYSAGIFCQKEKNKLSLSGEITLSYNYNKYYFGDQFNAYFGISTELKIFEN